MLRRLLIICVLFTMGFASLPGVDVQAANKGAQQLAAKTTKTISKKKAINAAKSQVKGKVLSANLIGSKGPPVYRIKMLVGESRVRTVFVDGVTGKVIQIN